MAGKRKTYGKTTAPAMSYNAAMSLQMHGQPIRYASEFQFAAVLEILVMTATNPVAVRTQLVGADYSHNPDRWFAILTLLEYGVSIDTIFKQEGNNR